MHNDAAVPHNPERKLIPRGVVDAHDIAGRKFTVGPHHTFGQETFAGAADSRARPLINYKNAGWFLEKCDPPFPTFELAGFRQKNRAGIRARNQFGNHVSTVAIGNNQRNTGPDTNLGGVNFGFHAAHTGDTVGPARLRFNFAGDFRNDRNDLLVSVEQASHV